MSGHMGEGKWNSLTLPTQPFLRQQSLGPGEPFSAVTPPMGGGGAGEGVVTWKMKLLQLPGSMAEGGREVARAHPGAGGGGGRAEHQQGSTSEALAGTRGSRGGRVAGLEGTWQ